MPSNPVEVSLDPDPVIDASEKDVERSLLRERLTRSVEERLLDLARLQAAADELRRSGRRARR